MPFYTYKCPSCEFEKEFLQGFNDDAPNCEKCDKGNQIVEMEKQLSFTARPKFNCSGFYETDYTKHKDRKDKAAHNYKQRRKVGMEHEDPDVTPCPNHIKLTKPRKKTINQRLKKYNKLKKNKK